ncbi:MAG: MXAN_2562 family outer membrane beta-barrel protein [Myxococcota bacterium]|nr:MXAN_2562 family outer membrane beta-barrel protein [Myxococcota bacterium]
MRWSLLCIILFIGMIPRGANAYVPSPQYGAFELKFGPYRPAVDKNDSLDGTPYEDTFGNAMMFLTTLELDWQFWHPPGLSLGIGGSVGFMQEYKQSEILDASGAATDVESADYTVLNVIPFAALFVVRVDILADALGVPLVPFAKAGLNWYLWWVHDGGKVPTLQGPNGQQEKGAGGTIGWQFSTGLMFRLDDFDQMSARTFDNEAGVNHSYLFAEVLWAVVDRFGNDDFMNLSTDTAGSATFLFGLALEF